MIYKQKGIKPKIGAAIAWASEPSELERVAHWVSFVPRVFIHTNLPVPRKDGLFWLKSGPTLPTFAQLVGTYLMRIPGGEIFVIATPDVVLGGKTKEIVEFVYKSNIQNAWAAFDRGPNENQTPKLFVMTAAVLAQALRDIPPELTLTGDSWAAWLHSWLGKYVLRPRYFDAREYGLVATVASVSPVLNAYEMAKPEPVKTPVIEAKHAPIVADEQLTSLTQPTKSPSRSSIKKILDAVF